MSEFPPRPDRRGRKNEGYAVDRGYRTYYRRGNLCPTCEARMALVVREGYWTLVCEKCSTVRPSFFAAWKGST